MEQRPEKGGQVGGLRGFRWRMQLEEGYRRWWGGGAVGWGLIHDEHTGHLEEATYKWSHVVPV